MSFFITSKDPLWEGKTLMSHPTDGERFCQLITSGSLIFTAVKQNMKTDCSSDYSDKSVTQEHLDCQQIHTQLQPSTDTSMPGKMGINVQSCWSVPRLKRNTGTTVAFSRLIVPVSVGAKGFEPSTSTTPLQRPSQAGPRPDASQIIHEKFFYANISLDGQTVKLQEMKKLPEMCEMRWYQKSYGPIGRTADSFER